MSDKTYEQDPYGVPLTQLAAALEPTSLVYSRDGNRLIVEHEALQTIVDVFRPAHLDASDNKISAVVKITTEIPKELADFLKNSEFLGIFNSFSTLGSLYEEDGRYFIGSRLTSFEGENAWAVQFPLMLLAVIGSAEQMISAMNRVFTGQGINEGRSDWTEADMEFVENKLSSMCFCNSGGLGFTAEFALKPGETAAIIGDGNTALWQLRADAPHPEAGGGLFCLLQLPYVFEDQETVNKVAARLNQMEMAPHDLPPHFGAWCPSKSGNLLAYCSFLPNVFHQVRGIAVNMSIWAMHRAQIADGMVRLIHPKIT